MSLPIPIISIELQKEISNLVLESNLSRREAKALLEKAKREKQQKAQKEAFAEFDFQRYNYDDK
jgi:hypothetical protein